MAEREKPTLDTEADAAYFPIAPTIGDGEAAEQHVIERPQGYVILDFTRDGKLLGVEVIGATGLLTDETVRLAIGDDAEPR